MAIFEKPLFIFEMANNHQGSVDHGKIIIRSMKEVARPYEGIFDFAVKFQYRDLDTFIHPEYQKRYDVKNVARFQETRLTMKEFGELKEEVEELGMYTICTPFDEVSADRIADQGYDAVKIASCSFTDWPLLERIAEKEMPVIASAAGSSLADIDKVASFFCHRGVPLALMHCVAQYPTREEDLQLNQITLFKKRYPNLKIGFSTHESPDNTEPVKAAMAMGAALFEKHVGVRGEGITLNEYSADPAQVSAWLAAAYRTFRMCGVAGERYSPAQKEREDLAALQRGVFAKEDLAEGESLQRDKIFLAFPCAKGQLLASDLSKYAHITLKKGCRRGEPVMADGAEIADARERVQEIVLKIMRMLKKSHVVIPVNSCCEISHHYGMASFEETGVAMIDCVNREYCKKILVMLPGQSHPSHFHRCKEETFTVLYGSLTILCQGEERTVAKGESMVVERGMEHSFRSEDGCVFEEISTTHYPEDSFYHNKEEFVNPRKTRVYITKEMLDGLAL